MLATLVKQIECLSPLAYRFDVQTNLRLACEVCLFNELDLLVLQRIAKEVMFAYLTWQEMCQEDFKLACLCLCTGVKEVQALSIAGEAREVDP